MRDLILLPEVRFDRVGMQGEKVEGGRCLNDYMGAVNDDDDKRGIAEGE